MANLSSVLMLFYIFFNDFSCCFGQCLERLVATQEEQILTTPNYPMNYPNNLNCTWLIVPQNPGEQVQIDITSFHSEPCCDYLNIKDGTVNAAGKIANLRGSYSGGKFVSSFGGLQVEFITDGSVTNRGFNLRYKNVQIHSMPTKVLQASLTTGVLVSPNWPFSYPQNSHHTWTIIAPSLTHAYLTILYLKTEACCDGLLIRDGDSETSPVLADLRGEKTGLLFSSSIGNPLSLRFYADATVNEWGFFSSYFTLTDDLQLSIDRPVASEYTQTSYNISEGFDTIMSPNFPTKYSSNLLNSWVVESPLGTRIRLWFTYFETEECCDWIKIRDGRQHNREKLGVLSGESRSFQSFVSSDNFIRLEFDTNLEYNRRGFIAIYEVVPRGSPATSSCGGELIANSSFQFVSSPNWPQPFNALQECDWRIRSEPRSTKIEFTLLGLLANPFQYVFRLKDGMTDQSEEILNLTDNSFEPITIISTGSYLTLRFSHFVSNQTESNGGFRASYISYPS